MMITEEEIQEVLRRHYRGFQMDRDDELTLMDVGIDQLAAEIWEAIDIREFIEGGC